MWGASPKPAPPEAGEPGWALLPAASSAACEAPGGGVHTGPEEGPHCPLPPAASVYPSASRDPCSSRLTAASTVPSMGLGVSVSAEEPQVGSHLHVETWSPGWPSGAQVDPIYHCVCTSRVGCPGPSAQAASEGLRAPRPVGSDTPGL